MRNLPSSALTARVVDHLDARIQALRTELGADSPPLEPTNLDTARNPLRPDSFDEMVGQERMRKILKRLVDASHASGEPMDHILLVGASGTGKTTTAIVLARELRTRAFLLKAPVDMETLEKLRVSAQDGDVVFVDEALALDTPIPTPWGWTTVGQLHPGDEILGAQGRPTTVLGLTPIRTTDVRYLVEFRDGTHVVTDAGHQWIAAPRGGGATTYLKPRLTTTKKMFDSARPWRIPNPQAVELPAARLPMDPYIFGQWLGNGNRRQCYINVRNDLADKLLNLVRQVYSHARYLDHPVGNGSLRRLTLSPRGLGGTRGPRGGSAKGAARQDLENTGAFRNKHLPDIYLRSSIEQRLQLLRGLMDTEGYITDSGTAVFSNTNSSIVLGVAEILRSLGYMPSVRFAGDEQGHKQCYKITFHPTPDRNPFLLRNAEKVSERIHGDQRLVLSITPIEGGTVRCLEVDAPDHLFLAGRGMVPTHNCHMWSSGDRRGRSQAPDPESVFTLLEDGVLMTAHGRLDFPHVTWIGATTDVGLLPEPLVNRFPIQPALEPYTEDDMVEIARRNAQALNLSLADGIAKVFAGASRRNPRQLNSYMRATRKLSFGPDPVNKELAREIIEDLNGTTLDGLDRSMQAMLRYIYRFGRTDTKDGEIYKASAGALATAAGHGRDTKAIYSKEIYLVETGLLSIQPRGRTLTKQGIKRAKELLR